MGGLPSIIASATTAKKKIAAFVLFDSVQGFWHSPPHGVVKVMRGLRTGSWTMSDCGMAEGAFTTGVPIEPHCKGGGGSGI